MTTQQLHCFLCVADHLNFTRAAEELFLSPPTVTHHIQSLEAELDTKLFIRSKKSVRLTEAGMVFYNDANDIMARFDLAKKHAEKMKQKHFSVLRIGYSSHAELPRLTSILEKFRKHCPEVYPSIKMANYTQLLSMQNDRLIDVVFGTKNMMKGVIGYTFRTLAKMQSCALVRTDDPLAEKPQVTFDDFEENCCVVLHPKMVPYQYGNQLQEKIHRRAQTQLDIICEDDQALISLVAAGYGIGILPAFCISQSSESMGIKKVPLLEGVELEYGISYPSKGKSDSIKEFIKICGL